MNKSDLFLLLKQLQIRPKKQKGQTFLVDNNIRDKILSIADITPDDIILEVGPGLGILTEILLQKAKQVVAIELEPKFCAYLKEKFKEHRNLTIINGDILETPLPYHNKVISNLPFSATGPILEKLFFKPNAPQGTIMLEKKLAERILNKGDYKTFSRLTVSVNTFMIPESSFTVSPNSFYPKPRIEISILKMNPRDIIDPFLTSGEKKAFFLDFIAGIMPYKNKNIANSIPLDFANKDESTLDKDAILTLLAQFNFNNDKVSAFEISELLDIAKILNEKFVDSGGIN
ncbi:MAG: ribosomal RNA small subunit methyltransferase A [Promethearchaeota archaeon]|nr:MAG: ribosomal RNA small subunit methyltransferase A [Candidatus Lokiarchaeota archaeon]